MKNTILAVMSTNRNGMAESGRTAENAAQPEQRDGVRRKCRNAAF